MHKSSIRNIREHLTLPRNVDKTQHGEATSGASRADAPREEAWNCLRPMARVTSAVGGEGIPDRGKSGLNIVRWSGQSAQYVVRVSDMDSKRHLSRRQEANNLLTCIPLEAAAYMTNSVIKKSMAWPPRAPTSATAKDMERMLGRLLTPYEYFSNLVFSSRHRAT
jgi:hypothetical protein